KGTVPQPAQLEVCGIHSVNAPWCEEALPLNTLEFQRAQLLVIPIIGEDQQIWFRANRDRRGIGFTKPGEDGKQEMAGRGVIKAVSRVYAYPPAGGTGQPVLLPAVAAEDGSSLTVLFPARGDFTGWTVFALSSRGDYALTIDGRVHRIQRRERRHDRLLNAIPPELAASQVTSTVLVARGDGSMVIEALEVTFTDRVRLSDGRRFSGLPGTFTPISEGGTTVLAFTREDTVGDRMVSCGNLRIDPATGVMTGGVSLIPQGVQLLLTALKSRC
ncbi:MAG: hypothetical protein RL693_83, partial [Verrucomicrobiota bacterium]